MALALSALHDERMISKYGAHHFITRQTVGTVDCFWAELADTLRIPMDLGT